MKKLVALLLVIAAVGSAIAMRKPAPVTPCLTVHTTHFAHRVTAEGNLRAVEATAIVVPRIEGLSSSLLVSWLAADGTPVAEGDVIVRFDRVAADKALREAEANLEIADVQLARGRIDAAASARKADTAADLATQQTELTRQFQAKDPKLYTRNQIIEGSLDEGLAEARLAQTHRARVTDRGVHRADLESSLALARQRAVLALDHARTAVAHLELRAPHAGLLVYERNGDAPKLGARVWQEQTIGKLPALDAMEAELFVLEVDGSGLVPGKPARVVVASHPDVTFGGTIKSIDPLAKPRDLGVPVQYISVVVALDKTDRDVMKPGQRVRATLDLGQDDTIVVPRQAVFEEAGRSVVYRRGEHGYAPVAVELGASTAGRVAITRGISDGDVIALRAPQTMRSAQLGPETK